MERSHFPMTELYETANADARVEKIYSSYYR
jgi:hypothetical protein